MELNAPEQRETVHPVGLRSVASAGAWEGYNSSAIAMTLAVGTIMLPRVESSRADLNEPN